ncbi:MAG: hypothetical protein HN955_12220 [Prolixibacteraceae bacterium]|jgi:hypothetical protein|nr:hypothetical protein [Prolixibacteraceae bacterium]MBT6006745.1 hypothetical protein [Prolixibacteraceae bacterium]MBT6999203.1 hypothetical protein [Prolixibacteraceae bacterium]
MSIKNILPVKSILFILLFQFSYIIPALSCSTPVFRYALERWPAFLYTVEVIHNGNLNDEQNQSIKLLKEKSTGNISTNMRVVETTTTEKHNIPDDKLPIIRLFYPMESNNPGVLWEGELTKENVNKIIDSPARREIVRRIQKGDAVAWVLVESADAYQNDLASKVLNDELKVLSKELKLSSTATNANGEPLEIDIVKKGVHFSMLKVSRSDPAEEIFIKMLLGTEPDLPFIKAPIAFPVFGRGRVLYALVGRGIKEKLIEETCNSVIGWCSCTIKEDNPGSDLLFSADWEKAIGDSSWIQAEEIPEISGFSEFIIPEKEIVAESPVENELIREEIDTKSEESEEETIEPTIEKVTENEFPNQVEENKKIKEIELAETQNETLLKTTETDKTTFSNLTRNILLVFLFLIILIPILSFLLKRKANK